MNNINLANADLNFNLALSTYIEGNKLILLKYSLGIDPLALANVISKDIARTTNKNIYIVSFDENIPKQFIIPYTNNNIVENPTETRKIIFYADFLTYLSNNIITNSIILFDSVTYANYIIGTDIIKKLINDKNTIIIMYTFGITGKDIDKLKHIHNIIFCNADFADHGLQIQNIKFRTHYSNMTLKQNNMYDRISKDVEKQQLCNISYPEEIEQIINTLPDIYKVNMKLIPKDYMVSSIVKNYKDQLLKDSEKLTKLLIFLTLNKDKKHLIFTKYFHYYGLELIESLLKENGFLVYTVNKNMNMSERTAIVNNFNSSMGNNIFLTMTHELDIMPRGINHLHMLDGSLQNTKILIGKLYKYNNYDSILPPNIVIHFHVCKKLSGHDSIDSIEYNKYYHDLERDLNFFNSLENIKQKHIVLGDNGLEII
jgi:hypothetical protein